MEISPCNVDSLFSFNSFRTEFCSFSNTFTISIYKSRSVAGFVLGTSVGLYINSTACNFNIWERIVACIFCFCIVVKIPLGRNTLAVGVDIYVTAVNLYKTFARMLFGAFYNNSTAFVICVGSSSFYRNISVFHNKCIYSLNTVSTAACDIEISAVYPNIIF